MAYKVTINTAKYQPLRSSAKNWEPGTINDHMRALNGWTSSELDLAEVEWRLHMFAGTNPGCEVMSLPRYKSWADQEKNTIIFHDELCGFDRETEITPPGSKQGYMNIPAILSVLQKEGAVTIAFSKVYDSRQYLKNMDGCFLSIERIGAAPTPPAMPVRVTGNFDSGGVNFQLMSEGQKNAAGMYIPNWEQLLKGASCQEEVDYIRRLRIEIENGEFFSGFAWNLVYITRQTCGHFEVFQTPCNMHHPLAEIMKHAREHASTSRCTRCICGRSS